jgi:hypothetical protein
VRYFQHSSRITDCFATEAICIFWSMSYKTYEKAGLGYMLCRNNSSQWGQYNQTAAIKLTYHPAFSFICSILFLKSQSDAYEHHMKSSVMNTHVWTLYWNRGGSTVSWKPRMTAKINTCIKKSASSLSICAFALLFTLRTSMGQHSSKQYCYSPWAESPSLFMQPVTLLPYPRESVIVPRAEPDESRPCSLFL